MLLITVFWKRRMQVSGISDYEWFWKSGFSFKTPEATWGSITVDFTHGFYFPSDALFQRLHMWDINNENGKFQWNCHHFCVLTRSISVYFYYSRWSFHGRSTFSIINDWMLPTLIFALWDRKKANWFLDFANRA